MQDVSYEPLMLQLPENPQASLDIFSQPHHHPFGFCIYRKAINRDKHLSSGNFCSTTDWTDWTDLLVEEIDQKVSVGLEGIPPWAFRHRSLLKTRLGSSPMPQLPVLPCRTFQTPRKQNSCRWQYKIGSHGATTISFAWCEAPPLSSSVLPK